MTIPGIASPAVPYGEFIVVSGVTGFIGSHVADQLLTAGYKVRGTTRSVRKGVWAEEYFKKKYGSDNFELREVPDMAAEGAFDEVVQGECLWSAHFGRKPLLTMTQVQPVLSMLRTTWGKKQTPVPRCRRR